jgi:Arc/MetJ-type ribon-helix-helix transcriptional regulator
MKVTRVDVRLPFELKQFVDDEIKAGRFKNITDAVSEGIRLLRQRADLAGTVTSAWMPIALGGQDIEALIVLVLMEAAKSAEEDLKAIMAQVKATTAAKRALRDLIAKVEYDVAENAEQRNGQPALRFDPSGIGSELGYHRMRLPHPDPRLPGSVRLVPTDMHKGRVTDVCLLRAIQDELLGKLDGMSEMGDMTSLRLQMMMDRRSKFVSTLSNVMKKMSETSAQLTADLK